MASIPLACPACRTWFEGSGRSARCPACGHRFSADEGALGRTTQAAAPNTPIEGWAYEPSAAQKASDAYSSGTRHEPAPDWHTTLEESRDYEVAAPEAEQRPADSTAQGSGRPNLSVIFSLAFLALVFVGPRFLEGNLFLIVLGVMMAARWLYGRWSKAAPRPGA